MGVIKKTSTLIVSAAIFGGVAGGVFNLVTGDNFQNNYGALKDSFDVVTEKVISDDSNDKKDEAIAVKEDTEVAQSDGVITTGYLDVSDIVNESMPSVVAITIKTVYEYNYGWYGQTYEYETQGSGSGIIIGENDTELLIVTNYHVVSDADTVSVAFIDNEVYEAKVKGTDSDNDLAVIVVNLEDLSDETLSQIKIAKLGSSDDLQIGEQVVAIGNALGYGQSVTTGIVSAKDRENSTNATPLIQTDAAINPGNSGGALLNMRGEVVGINSSKYASTDVEGMGYAIPISSVESIIDELSLKVTREKVDENMIGYLGVECRTVSTDMSLSYYIPVGAYVVSVVENSPAAKAGIEENMVITKFDGQSVTSAEGLVDLLEYYKAGEIVDVTCMVMENGEFVENTYTVRLDRRSDNIQ
ncbi:MAG: S1C family serine protease [Wujia sp.]